MRCRCCIITGTVSVHLKLLLACLFWGLTPTIGRVLAEFKAPFVVVCGRFMVAAVFLLWFCFAAQQFRRVPKALWWRFAAMGASGIALHNGLLYKGLEYTSASTASIVVALISIQVVILDTLVYRRLPDRLTAVGVILSFIGTALVLTDGHLGQLFVIGVGRGEVLAFLSALSWAVYSLLGRALLEAYSPLLVTTYAALAGLAMLLPFLFVDDVATVAVFSDPRALLLMFFLGLVGTALGFLWYSQALLSLGTVGTAVYINLTPIFGVIAASLLLGEKSSHAVVAGGALVCASLMLVNRPQWPWRRAAVDAVPPAVPVSRPSRAR